MLSMIVPLAVAVLAVRIVTRAIAGTEEQRYLDTLLAAPVSRSLRPVAQRLGIVIAIVVRAVDHYGHHGVLRRRGLARHG
jgi:ABC-type Na+ efflux pump permease subunit